MVMKTKTSLATIEDDDVVIFFNFRTDRGRELTASQQDFHEQNMHKLLYYVTLTNYDETYKM
jgi:2,3-bisphosphoglycerate-independent phosphoglycerate mutase